jgi:hypothetical protein
MPLLLASRKVATILKGMQKFNLNENHWSRLSYAPAGKLGQRLSAQRLSGQ